MNLAQDLVIKSWSSTDKRLHKKNDQYIKGKIQYRGKINRLKERPTGQKPDEKIDR